MDQGTAVGVEAQKAFPGGVFAEADYRHTGVALEETARLMANPRVPAISEASLYAEIVAPVSWTEQFVRVEIRLDWLLG
jgi:hypothetical protein